jgi:hypothetical protein
MEMRRNATRIDVGRRANCFDDERSMAGEDRSRSERIRALIEESDRVRHESEQVRSQVDRTMKRPFWPDRRRTVRVPGSPYPRDRGENP